MPKITQEHITFAQDTAKRILDTYQEKGGTFEIIIHKTSKSNMTWRYSVRLWYVGEDNKVRAWLLNYVITAFTNQKLTKEGYLTGYGVGIERSFQVAYELGRAIGRTLEITNPDRTDGDNGYLFTRDIVLTC